MDLCRAGGFGRLHTLMGKKLESNELKERIKDYWRGVCLFPVGLFWKIMFRPVVIGLENIPRTGGALIACNHISGWETIFFPYHVMMASGPFSRRRVWTPAKEELFVPPVGWVIGSWRAFPVRRRQQDFASMDRIAQLASETIVTIFPEGTRSKTGALLPGKPAVGKIIHDSKCTVIPAVVFNTNYVTPKGKWFPRFFLPLSVVYGKPLDLSKYMAMESSKETSRLIVNEVMAAIARLQKEYAYLDIHHPNHKRP